jgi:hypothetical protein
MSEEIKIDAIIDEFYHLKSRYEEENYKSIILPIIRSKVSKKEKRAQYAKSAHFHCINCKRNVGTIFSIKAGTAVLNSDSSLKIDERHFVAKCGDVQNPCALNIQFVVSERKLYRNAIRLEQKEINILKENIIKLKNDNMFGYPIVGYPTLREAYAENKEYLENASQMAGFLIEDNNKINNSVEMRETLLSEQAQLKTVEIPTYNTLINEYNDTKEKGNLDLAIGQYINDIIPLENKVMKLKNEENFVEKDGDKYILIQRPNLVKKEFYDDGSDRIISNITGVRIGEQGKKTIKRTKKTDVATPKTRRLKIVKSFSDK